jgi:1-pyrroline-5-carboxylate dehydrogenase
VVSPIDCNIVLGEFHNAGGMGVARAVATARLTQPAWHGMGWEKRVAILRRVAEAFDKRKMELCVAAIYEVGKSRIEASAEIDETSDLIRHYAGEMAANDGFTGPKKVGFHRSTSRSR